MLQKPIKTCKMPLGPPWGPHGAPHGAPFPRKKFSRLCREHFFPPSRPWGPHGAPDLWSICLIYIEICSFSWKIRFRHRFKRVLWLKYRLYKIFRNLFFNFSFFFWYLKIVWGVWGWILVICFWKLPIL